MPKNISFSASEPLTTSQMNALLQDGQVQQTTGQSTSELMSQKAITDAITNSASSITVVAKPEFGNATTLQGVLNYLANTLNGTNTVTKIKAKEIDLVD